MILNELALSYLGKFLEELATAESELSEEKILFQTRTLREAIKVGERFGNLEVYSKIRSDTSN